MLIRPAAAAVFVIVVLLTACGGTDGASDPGSPGGTTTGAATGSWPRGNAKPPAGRAALEIVTQIGEQCPHIPVTPDPRCDPKPRPDTAFEVRTAGGDLVAGERSGGDGHATVYVPPGTYVVRGEPVAGYQFTPERRVTVSGGDSVAVPLTYTTGIQ